MRAGGELDFLQEGIAVEAVRRGGFSDRLEPRHRTPDTGQAATREHQRGTRPPVDELCHRDVEIELSGHGASLNTFSIARSRRTVVALAQPSELRREDLPQSGRAGAAVGSRRDGGP